MGDARPAHQAPGEQVGGVDFLGPLDAVGGHDDGPGELGELLGLVLPGGAVVAVEMGILLEAGVAVRGEHLAVGVDVDAFAFALLQDLFQVQEIVPGNQDGLAFLVPQGHLGGHRVAVPAGVARIQQFHGPQVDLAAFEHQRQEVVQAQVFSRRGRQTLVDEGIDLVVFLPQNPGVVGIGADPLMPNSRVCFRARISASAAG